MVIKSLKIKNKSYYFWNEMVYLNNFNANIVKIVKRESRIGVDIYYIVYIVNKPEYDVNSVNPLYLVVKNLLGRVEKIDGSSDRYLVVDKSNKELIDVFNTLWKFIEDKISLGNKINGYDKLKFISNIDLPLDTQIIEFHALTIIIRCVIKKTINIMQKFI